MKHKIYYLCIISFLSILFADGVFAQLLVEPLSSQSKMLESDDPILVKNKKLVYDFWREVLEAGHMELVDKYLAESYIQHNPRVPTGREGFVAVFSKIAKPKPILDTIKAAVVSIIAEKDLVMICFVDKREHPDDSTKKYTTTWFDMFRIENDKIAEHWDNATIKPKTPLIKTTEMKVKKKQ